MSFCMPLSWSLPSPDDKLSENIWFLWSKTSYSGEKIGCVGSDNQSYVCMVVLISSLYCNKLYTLVPWGGHYLHLF